MDESSGYRALKVESLWGFVQVRYMDGGTILLPNSMGQDAIQNFCDREEASEREKYPWIK